MHPKNKTEYRTMDRVAKDPRVARVYEDSDGIWMESSRGYHFEDCSTIRRDTVKEVLADFARVEEGEPC